MVATRHYEEYVKTAVKAGVDLIVSGAGLPTMLPELVKNTKIAKDIADVFSPGSAEERQKAEDGIVRYFRVINYEENVSHKIKEIAYIRVVEDNGKFRTQLYVKSKLLKENNANPEKVKNNINKIIKNIAA